MRNTIDRYHDGDDVVLEKRRVGQGAAQYARYVHGPNADQPLAMELYPAGSQPVPGSGQKFYYHADGEGSVRLVTDAAGQITNRYEYDSYGKRLVAIEGVEQPYSWKGREWLAGPDVYYNRARLYDPALGRFIGEDPIHYDAGDYNLYAFTWNNPKNWSDPSGKSAIESACLYSHAASNGASFAPVAIMVAGLWGGITTRVLMATGNVEGAAEAVKATKTAIAEITAVAVGIQAAVTLCAARNKPVASCAAPSRNSFGGDTMVWIKNGTQGDQEHPPGRSGARLESSHECADLEAGAWHVLARDRRRLPPDPRRRGRQADHHHCHRQPPVSAGRGERQRAATLGGGQ